MFEEKTVSSRPVYQGRAFNVRVDTVINAAGENTTRDIVEHAECIAAVAVSDNGDIFLVNQYRKAVEKSLLEIPAGGIEPGEDPQSAVRRELQEEIGYLPGRLERLAGFYSTPGFCTEYLHIFLASELQTSRLTAEDTAAIDVVRLPPFQITEMIAREQICDSKSIAALLLYLNRYCRS
jgi:ADP-ribose pyrophosphatase